MYAAERHRMIVEQAMQDDRVSVTGLAERFGVTTETIRRDLDTLDRRGVLRRVHGGAVVAKKVALSETDLVEREPANASQKQRIAQAALALLPGGQGSVLFDAGTTTFRLADLVAPGSVRTVVTNSLPLAGRLAAKSLNVQLLGGRVRGITGATVGATTVAALSRLHCDVAFIGANGFSLRRGLSTPDPDEAIVKEAMVAAAAKVVVLADSSKFGAELMTSFADLDQIDVLITDPGLAEADQVELRAAGVAVVIA
jgi:DeoR family transcriptional regulator, fructose operon transcriptional repressor